MTIPLTELLKDYKHSIERALAGEITGKRDQELSDDDVDNASDATKKITNLIDYKNLVDALDDDGDNSVDSILAKYNIKHMAESDYIDRDLLMREGFKFYGVFEDEKIRGQVTGYLDENEIEYMDDGTGHVQMKFADRESAYRVEEHVARMIRQSNPRFVRDHIERQNSLSERSNRFDRFTNVEELQRLADKLARDGAPEDAKRLIHARIRELEGVDESRTKRKKPSTPRDPAHSTMLAKRQSGAAGAHSSAKYNKADRRNNKFDVKRGVYND